MSTFRVLIASVSLFCFFMSCRKEDVPAAGDRLLQRVVSTGGDTIGYTSYQYDAQMRLVAITDSSNNKGNGTGQTSIEYDTTGNPIKFTHHHHYPNRLDDDWVGLLVRENGKVIQKLVNDIAPTFYVTSNTYTYDLKGRLIRDSVGKYGYTDFLYDDNDNIVKMQRFNMYPGRITTSDTVTVSHDSNLNPYHSLGLILYFITNSNELLSKHNRTQLTYKWNDRTYTNIYTYEYENGLPKKRTVSWDNDSSIKLYTLDFYYN